MADNSKQIDWEQLDIARLTQAFDEIQRSENLRFLFRTVFAQLGVTSTPIGDDPHSMALAVGRHLAGTELVELFELERPGLFASLLVENSEELKQRRVDGAYT